MVMEPHFKLGKERMMKGISLRRLSPIASRLINIIRKIHHFLRKIVEYPGRIHFKLILADYAQTDFLLKQETVKLLAKQFIGNDFNRLDVIVRYLAIEEYFGKNDFGFSLYNKMQKQRGASPSSEEKFRSLIESVVDKGFDSSSRIQVDLDQRLLDGSHRLALSLYFKEQDIPLEVVPYKANVVYGAAWFKIHNFTQQELEIIENKKREIFRAQGLYFSVVLWPPVQKHFDEIEHSLSQEYFVVATDDYDFRNRFEEIVRRIYAIDNIADWKVTKKLEAMSCGSTRVRHILIEIPNPRFRKKGVYNSDISKEGEAIKEKYRRIYKSKVDNYFNDILIHTGDNYKHNAHIIRLFDEKIEEKKYKNNGFYGGSGM